MNTKTVYAAGISTLLLGLAFILNLSLGSVHIPFGEVLKILTGQAAENENWAYIVTAYRLPKAVTAVLAGSGLALSGLFMQTLFQNPLAGPYVLGVSSGASLGVAILVMGSGLLGLSYSVLSSSWATVIAAGLGSFAVMLLVILIALRLRNTMAVLIVGIMFAALTGALVTVLSYFTSSELLQRYVFWSFGSLGNLSSSELLTLSIFWGVGILLSLFCLKDLNALLLGERYAKSMGVNLKKNRLLVILVTCLLTGSLTAFAGPIAFIGLATPHLVRLLISVSDHRVLTPVVVICGAVLMLICDTIAQLPGSQHILPINAVTSIFGAPIIIWLLLKKRKIVF